LQAVIDHLIKGVKSSILIALDSKAPIDCGVFLNPAAHEGAEKFPPPAISSAVLLLPE
jgi:hypothetical protein